MLYIFIAISTYTILWLFANYKISFGEKEFDSTRIASHIPKLFFLDYFLKISLVESLLNSDSQSLKVLVYQSLVIIFLTRGYFYLRVHWLEKIIDLSGNFIFSLFKPNAGELEQQEKIRIVRENQLQCLDLSHSSLRHIPNEIFDLTYLESLSLNDNKIREITQEIVKLKNLKHLDLNNNKISSVPGFISQIPQLEILAISNNNLNKLPKEFSQLSNLTSLYLGNNKFEVFPSCLLKLNCLKSLSLSYNQISELPRQLANMPNLKYLYTNFNRIDNNSLSAIRELIESEPSHTFNRDTGKVEPNKEKLTLDNRVAEDSILSFKSKDLFKFIVLSISSTATFEFIFKQQGIYNLILSDSYFFLSVGIIMFSLAFYLRRKNFITVILLTNLSSILIGLFLVWIYK